MVSGIPSWSSSGVMFAGASWSDGSVNRALHLDQDYYRDRMDFSTLGYFGMGSASTSGFTIMGWAKVTDTTTNATTPRKIWGNIEDTASATDGEWMLTIRPDNRDVEFTYNGFGAATIPVGAIQSVSSLSDPNNITDPDEPFFFAAQLSKGNPVSNANSSQGSGILRLFLGTTVSGLREVGTTSITVPGSNFWRGDNTQHGTNNYTYTFGADPRSARGISNTRHLPPSSIIDEFCIVLDGNVSLPRMRHYMNSGIIQDGTDPFGLEQTFEPTLPGTTDLVAYWTFDEQGGANTSPHTGDNLNMHLDGVSFVDGIRGGSGIRPNNTLSNFNSYSAPSNKNGHAHVPHLSGLNYLFPKEGKSQTWIGWIRAQGGSHTGGAVGWFAGPDRHNAFGWNQYIFSITSSRPSAIDTALTPSGNIGPQRVASIGGISASFNSNDAREQLSDHWHLLAMVWDMDTGTSYVVRDAQDIYPMLTANTEISGITDEHIRTFTSNRAMFGLLTASTSNRCSYDDWAVYDRVLTLPEMSGYAMSGVEIIPTISRFNTSFKQTLGCWKFDDESKNIYDPTGISGIRYNDDSWYRHHLTNVSGSVEISDTSLNSDVQGNSLRVNTSGANLSIEREFLGGNLDFSSSNILPSGFTAGCYMFLPSGDLQTEGNGSSGLYGSHHIMGSWSQTSEERSWQLGIKDNKFIISIQGEFVGVPSELESTDNAVPYEKPFFIAASITPSGGNITAELYVSTNFIDQDTLSLVGRSIGFPSSDSLVSSSTSGFSLLNVGNMQQGFPSGTLIQNAFVYNGGMDSLDIASVVTSPIGNITLTSDSVSATDPANISHWRFDETGSRFIDHGQAQNPLGIINTDGHKIAVDTAIHSSGVIIRLAEYLTTDITSTTSGLDLGTDNKSWTFMTWVKPNASVPVGEGVIMGKGGASSGIEVFMVTNSLVPSSRANGVTVEANNGAFAPGEWNHVAVVFDRDNNEYATIVNGRYAGTAFGTLLEVQPNNSGMALGGRGDQESFGLPGGTAFSGMLDDSLLFSRVLTLPEISGIAANSYNFNDGSSNVDPVLAGGYIIGISQLFVSGLIGSFMHGQAQDVELVGGFITGVEGVCDGVGGFIRGRAFASGIAAGFMHGSDQVSGLFGHFMHGTDTVSGLAGAYTFGACESSNEFDISLNFRIVSFDSFDTRLGVEKTDSYEFDARLGVIRITRPPQCTLEMPFIGTIASGLPFDLVVTGSGIAQDDKKISHVRFTFADFKDAELGSLIGGQANSGLYSATRQFDTPGYYTVKIEVLDSFGYRSSCCRQLLLLPDNVSSGTYINSLPGISLDATPVSGSTIHAVTFTHALSGLNTTSGLLEYTDFADQQESLVNSLEMPVGTQFIDFTRRHDYTMPGSYNPVWSVSGSWGIVSDSISDGVDYLE
jgi:hypothetical protein